MKRRVIGLIFSTILFVSMKSNVYAQTNCAGVTLDFSKMLTKLSNEQHESDLVPLYDEEEAELLAKLITAEQGYDKDKYCYYLTGSVVLNRMCSDEFPNTLYEVIYQRGQYACTWNGMIKNDYDPVAFEVAKKLLVEGTTIPETVVFQAEFVQGSGIYEYMNNTYYCYR